ncbi:hypothetical protein DFH08DRAFT_1089772 [Mycena albidolilacea]|uniref:DUF6830 domain-containing protein n=1 Tax=Mycena albidolilacea TaxID=1033008 RepID=A0AAD6Z0U4_9AGAR|nr:hypothetical protein DFH08DRAFT_1089772 [Mycena albidolilacea]
MEFECPNCHQPFTLSSSVLKHLNHPRSSCIPWYNRMHELAISGDPSAEEYQRKLRRALGESERARGYETRSEPMDMDLPIPGEGGEDWGDTNMDFGRDSPVGGSNTDPDVEEFPNAAQPIGSGQTFMEWVDSDQFAPDRQKNIYYPFASKAEWEMASFLMRSSMTMKDIDDFFKLQHVQEHLPLSFKSAKELRARVELLPKGPQWNEWITGDGAWEMQAALPAGATLLGALGTSDKTNISVMNGDRVAHPFLISLANIDMDFLMKASNHAFMMCALLPVPKFLCHKDIRGLMERRLLHRCLDIVCAPLKRAALFGHPMTNSVGQLLRCHTPLAAYIVDTPEAADIACVSGKTSHVTMAQHKTFGDPIRQEERTGESTWLKICAVNSRVDPWDIFEYQKESKKLRLSGVHLPFWRDWSLSTNPARFLTPEPLHHWHRQFYDHDFQWCRKMLTDSEIDFRLSIIQPRIGFRHFKEGVTRIKQLGGREHRELERCIVAVIADGAPPQAVYAIRVLIDFRYFAQAPVIDEETMGRTTGSLDEFHQNKQRIIDAGGRQQKHFHIPKLEFMHSVVPSIRWAGVPMQFTADVTEKAHSTEIKVPARTETNHRDYDPQIARYLDRAEKMRLFDLATGLKSQLIAAGPEDEGEDHDDEPESLYDDVSTAAGESTRPIKNLFNVAKAHRDKYPHLESRMFTTLSTAFSLNRTPHLTRISIEDAAELFRLPDLRPALGDFFNRLQDRRSPDIPVIGGRRRCRPDCALPFTELDVWFGVRVQVMSPHSYKSSPLAAQNLQARPPNSEWPYGRFDTVLLCNDKTSAWPGGGFREGLRGHTVAQIRLIMRPIWKKSSEPLTTAYLMYAQRYDIVPQHGSATGREWSTGMYILKRATRADGQRLGDVTEVDNIRIPLELVPRFGPKADPRFTPHNSLECCSEVRLNKYSSKELLWIMESVSL